MATDHDPDLADLLSDAADAALAGDFSELEALLPPPTEPPTNFFDPALAVIRRFHVRGNRTRH